MRQTGQRRLFSGNLPVMLMWFLEAVAQQKNLESTESVSITKSKIEVQFYMPAT